MDTLAVIQGYLEANPQVNMRVHVRDEFHVIVELLDATGRLICGTGAAALPNCFERLATWIESV